MRPDEVKTTEDRTKVGPIQRPAKPRGFARYVDGWQLGVIVVGLSLLAVVFGVPRAAPPKALPMPQVDLAGLRADALVDTARVAQLQTQPLSFDIRSIGEAVRRYGAAVDKKDVDGTVAALREARGMTERARAHEGDEALLSLRAAQTEMFLAALRRFEVSGQPDQELVELAERFADKARESGWVRTDGTLVPTTAERRVLFQIRWAELLNLRKEPAFAPSANQLRAYYGFALAHPAKGTSSEAAIAVVTAVERVDLSYPGLFARGVLFYRAGRYDLAAEAFRGHLLKQPNFLRLRARNHLAASLANLKPDT